MDTILVIVTVLSLGFAVVLLIINWILLREERRRSAARVEVLAAAAAEPAVRVAPSPTAPPIIEMITLASAPAAPPSSAATTSITDRTTAEPAVDAFVHGTREAALAHELFHTTAEPPTSSRPLTLPVLLGVAIVGTIAGVLAISSYGGREEPNPRPVAAAGVENAVPLELIALRHDRTVDGLSISGMVRNPPTGHRISEVDVLVFLFDRNGAFLTSVKATLDFRTLAPGDESPFRVSLDKVGTLGRYRVSFRADNKVVPHVDRRQGPVVAVASQ